MPSEKDKSPNPILSAALGVFESMAPGALDDPAKAWPDLVPKLRWLVVARVEKPTISQLEALRAFDQASSLVQIRNAVQASGLRLGPFPGEWAERVLMPELLRRGLAVSLEELSAEEKARQLAGGHFQEEKRDG